ncbi:hypothetical protein BH10CYA1_BH10CYA1_64630 [soil metagenome]
MNTRTLKKELQYKIPQLRLALIRERSIETVAITTPRDIYHYAEPLKHMPEEHFVSFHLDTRNHIVGYHLVSHGTVSASLVHPREVFKAALLSNSTTIIAAHRVFVKCWGRENFRRPPFLFLVHQRNLFLRSLQRDALGHLVSASVVEHSGRV